MAGLLRTRPGMTHTLRAAALAAVFLCRSSFAAEPGTLLEAIALVPGDQDACLDLSVRELGMSAKRVEAERRWNIGPQYLHPTVKAGGSLDVKFEKGAGATQVRVSATWPGGPKPKDVQPEIEQRLVAMASKLAQICGVVRAEVKCTVTTAEGKSAACAPQP
jgi:hypothetical protein